MRSTKMEIEDVKSIIAKHVDHVSEDLITEIIEYFNYTGGKLAGQIAKKCGIPVGELGCPHCGVTIHGGIESPICNFCEKDRFCSDQSKS